MQIDKRIRLEQHYGLIYMGLQIERRVHLQLHQGNRSNDEFIYDYIKEKLYIVKTKREDSEMSSNLVKALEVYRTAWLKLAKTETSIEKIVTQETGLGLTGPENGCLTRQLETLFGWSSTFRLYALFHCLMLWKNLFENED